MHGTLYHMFTLGGMEVWRWIVSQVLFALLSHRWPRPYLPSDTMLGQVNVNVCLSTGPAHPSLPSLLQPQG